MRILQFNFNSKNYEIKKDNTGLHFLVNSKDASLNDKKLFYHIIKQLIPEYSTYTSSIGLNGREYKIYKDFSKNIYEFYPFTEDYPTLNTIFNNQKDYALYGLNDNQAFKRLVKVGKKIFFITLTPLIILSATTAYNSISSNNENISTTDIKTRLEQDLKSEDTNTYNATEYFYSEDLYPDITTNNSNNDSETYPKEFEIFSSLDSPDSNDTQNVTPSIIETSSNINVRAVLEEALSKNPTLKPEEKDVFLKLEEFITDNLEYIDLDWYTEILTNKRIDYINNRNYMASAKNFADNHIEIYNATSISEVDISIITHELLHDFERQNRQYWSDNTFFSETADVFFNNEYFNENNGILYDQSYNINPNYLYALIEIIGPKPIKDYFFSDDINHIKNALLDIIPDEEKATVLIELLNQLTKTTSSMYQNFSLQTLQRSINYILSNYYEVKYGKKIDSDLLMLTLTGYIDNKDLCALYGYKPVDIKPVYYQINNIKYYFNPNNYAEDSFNFSIVTSVSLTGETNYTGISISDENRYLDTVEKTR